MDPRRRSRRLTLGAAAAAALVLASCASPTVAEAARHGREDAARDLSAGDAHLVYVGQVVPWKSPLDRETGLTYASIGCCPSYALNAYRDAYNDVVLASLHEGRLEGLTLAHKATSREVLLARFRVGRVETLRAGAPAVEAPGGRFAVDVARSARGPSNALRVLDRETGERSELEAVAGDVAYALFDDEGTTLAVRDDRARRFQTFDLVQARLLEVFPDPEQ